MLRIFQKKNSYSINSLPIYYDVCLFNQHIFVNTRIVAHKQIFFLPGITKEIMKIEATEDKLKTARKHLIYLYIIYISKHINALISSNAHVFFFNENFSKTQCLNPCTYAYLH